MKNGKTHTDISVPRRPENSCSVLHTYTNEVLFVFDSRFPAERSSVNILVVCTETCLNLNPSELRNNELHWTTWSEATLNSSHFQICWKKIITSCIRVHKISRQSAHFCLLLLADYPNKPFCTVQKLIDFRVSKSGLWHCQSLTQHMQEKGSWHSHFA